jgi:predicted permease
VRLISRAADRDFLLEDLHDRFLEIAEAQGPQAAARWYWAQALSALPAALLPDIDLMRRRSWTGVLGDLRLGLRTLRRRPFYAVGVAGTLGLGLAAAVITFAVAWRVWLAPLPIPDPDGVVRLYEIEPVEAAGPQLGAEARRHLFSDALAVDFHGHDWETIEKVAFVMGRGGSRYPMTLDGEAFNLSTLTLPAEGFEILGIVPTLGRLPTVTEREDLLSERFWRAAFGADPDVLGSRFSHASGWSTEIVGVAPLPSGYPGDADVVGSFEWRVQGERDFRWYEMIARVRPEYSVAEAEAEMNAFLAALAEIHPEHRGWSIEAVVLKDDLIRPFHGVIVLLLAAGATFLVLAAVNVLGLAAARRVDGRHDRSVRLALGASEARLLRGALAEGMVLAALGAAAGVLGARWLLPAIRRMVPSDVPRLAEVAVTSPLLLTGLGVGLALGCATGLADYAVSRGGRPTLGRSPTWRAAGVGARRALVVGQVALTTLLTAGGAAILHRVSTLRATDLGFEAEGVWTTTADLGAVPRYDLSHDAFVDAMRALLGRLEGWGFTAAAAFNTPMSPTYGNDGLFPFSIRADSASAEIFYELHPIMGDYFAVMGIQILVGRTFQPTDDASSGNVVIVSEDFVDRYFPRTPAAQVLGRTLDGVVLMRGPATIVGVARSTRHRGPDTPSMPGIYIPYAQQRTLAIVKLLVPDDSSRISEVVPQVLAEVTPDVRWSPLVPYASFVSEWYAPFRFQLVMIGVLAALGLLLAALGLYALMAYQVAIRQHEIGIRKALGASDQSLLRGIVLPGMALSVIGAGIGLLVWYRLLPWTRELVAGIDAAGYVVPLSVSTVVGLSCVVATLVPAFRATSVDPVVTLKAE